MRAARGSALRWHGAPGIHCAGPWPRRAGRGGSSLCRAAETVRAACHESTRNPCRSQPVQRRSAGGRVSTSPIRRVTIGPATGSARKLPRCRGLCLTSSDTGWTFRDGRALPVPHQRSSTQAARIGGPSEHRLQHRRHLRPCRSRLARAARRCSPCARGKSLRRKRPPRRRPEPARFAVTVPWRSLPPASLQPRPSAGRPSASLHRGP